MTLPCSALSQLTQTGLAADGTKHQVTLQAQAFNAFLAAKDGADKFNALKSAMMLTWPEFTDDVKVVNGRAKFTPSNGWNPWLERMLRAFTNTEHAVKGGDTIFRYIGLTGCGGASKTHSAGLYAVAWWAASPHNSIAILTSTTVGMIRHRIWPVIDHYAKTAVDPITGKVVEFGHMITSSLELRASKGDAKHAIFALAVAHGETQKAIHNLKGMHAERILLIIDEANGTPEAIFETIPNLLKGALDVTVIIIGNPFGRLDPHGRAITPEDGWEVFNEDLLEWNNRPVPEWQLDRGIVLRFDGKESPNVKLGYNKHPYIYTVDNWNRDNQPGVVGTFAYYTQARGMHPPAGFEATVFTEQLFIRCEYDDTYTFDGETELVCSLDPAFGGDACWLQFGKMGMVKGKMCVQLLDGFEVPLDPNAAAHDVDYQIARRVKQECTNRGVKPHLFGIDSTGVGRGVTAILAAEWSTDIQSVQFGMGATDRPSAQNDGRPARETYSNFVTELWYAVREGLEAGQIKGFTRTAVSQAIARMFEMKGKKIAIESKVDMRARMRCSPDEFDSIAILWEVCRRNGLSIEGRVAQSSGSSWMKQVMRSQEESPIDTDAVVSVASDGGWANESFY